VHRDTDGSVLGVGMVYCPALGPVFEAGPDVVAVAELEPQTLWRTVCSEGKWRYRVDGWALDAVAVLPQRKLVHGVGQPLAGSIDDPLDYRTPLRGVVDLLDPPWVSEHLSFVRTAGASGIEHAGFLLPPAQTPEQVAVAAENIDDYRRVVGRPVAFETGVDYRAPREDELDDGVFFRDVAARSGSGIVLDLHNLWCNEVNGRGAVRDVLSRIPLDRVWEVHVAGGDDLDGYRLDAHSGAVPGELLDLTADVVPRLPNLRALTFEIMPSHVPHLGLDGVHAQLERLWQIWDLRPDAAPEPFPTAIATRASAAERATVHRAERNLVAALRGSELAEPGVLLYRRLVDEQRRAHLAQALRYTTTALLTTLGAAATEAVIAEHLSAHPPEMTPGVEGYRFATYLASRPGLIDAVPHLRQVLEFETALLRAALFGTSTVVEWDVDPAGVLDALDEGRAPGVLEPQSYSVSVEI